ncbi:MAG TPA: hypothetical protein VIL77_08450 [Gaiellaceae bacterium]
MKRAIAIFGALVVVGVGATSAAADTTVEHGYACTIGLPTPDNQGVLFTTTKSVTVITDNGAAVTHCTFMNTGYTPPDSPFPFNCNIQGTPADVTELHMTQNGTIVLTCVATPQH